MPAQDNLSEHAWRAIAARTAQVETMQARRKPRTDAQKHTEARHSPRPDFPVLGDGVCGHRATGGSRLQPKGIAPVFAR
ncbi:hypothetical protein GCM10010991_08590 [Gemmobacter aquaticus]|uniref:Uncharacterized protein n=1 Tax=Gemmobacter aquaticus TaxID=490185 RepID=A0A917YHV7_9RHOB|nr:hypothetical protein GCM10010991_08590 [Gemmobacter aquaticus]